MQANQPGFGHPQYIKHPHNEEPKDVEIPPYVVVIETGDSISESFKERLGEAYRAQHDFVIDTGSDTTHTFEFQSAVSMWTFARKAITIAENMAIVDFSIEATTAPVN